MLYYFDFQDDATSIIHWAMKPLDNLQAFADFCMPVLNMPLSTTITKAKESWSIVCWEITFITTFTTT